MSSGTLLAKRPSPIWWGLMKGFAPRNRIPTLEQRQVLVLSRSLAQTLLVLVLAILVTKPSRWLIHALKTENASSVPALTHKYCFYPLKLHMDCTTHPTTHHNIHAPHSKTIHHAIIPSTCSLADSASDLLTISCNLFLLPRVSSTFIQTYVSSHGFLYLYARLPFMLCLVPSLAPLFIPVLCYLWKYSIPYFFLDL